MWPVGCGVAVVMQSDYFNEEFIISKIDFRTRVVTPNTTPVQTGSSHAGLKSGSADVPVARVCVTQVFEGGTLEAARPPVASGAVAEAREQARRARKASAEARRASERRGERGKASEARQGERLRRGKASEARRAWRRGEQGEARQASKAEPMAIEARRAMRCEVERCDASEALQAR